MKITEFTISLHCGFDKRVVDYQMSLLKPLESKYKIYWNNRIDRHPDTYNSYSELVNDAVITSPTEFVILINDRCHPMPYEVIAILELMEQGYAAATKYSVGFIGVSKELFRKIGFWDERFYGGGYEDDDFVLRLRMSNLAYYESLEGKYDMSWKTPLQPLDGLRLAKSEPYFQSKWKVTDEEIKRVILEEKYEKYEGKLGESRTDISDSWLNWDQSKLDVFFPQRGSLSRSHWFRKSDGSEYRKVTSI